MLGGEVGRLCGGASCRIDCEGRNARKGFGEETGKGSEETVAVERIMTVVRGCPALHCLSVCPRARKRRRAAEAILTRIPDAMQIPFACMSHLPS